MRQALGELGRSLGEHKIVVSPEDRVLEVEVDEALVGTDAMQVLEGHDCSLELLDFANHRIA